MSTERDSVSLTTTRLRSAVVVGSPKPRSRTYQGASTPTRALYPIDRDSANAAVPDAWLARAVAQLGAAARGRVAP